MLLEKTAIKDSTNSEIVRIHKSYKFNCLLQSECYFVSGDFNEIQFF